MISFTQRIAIPENVLVRELDGESVLLNLDTERYHGLDEAGTGFWRALSETGSIQAAYDRLLAEYEVAPETLRGDLERLIGELVAQGLIALEPAE
ncbi:MAG: PqqD family protein [Thermoanaerobaculia bacterium]